MQSFYCGNIIVIFWASCDKNFSVINGHTLGFYFTNIVTSDKRQYFSHYICGEIRNISVLRLKKFLYTCFFSAVQIGLLLMHTFSRHEKHACIILPPLKATFIYVVKLVFTVVYIIFLISSQKHRL